MSLSSLTTSQYIQKIRVITGTYFRVVLQVLKENQLFAKYSKCEFWLRSVMFLGHIISSKGVEVDRKIIEAVKNCLSPLTPTDIRISWF